MNLNKATDAPADVLLLNTAVLDLKGEQFNFVRELAGPGGLAKCPTEKMPDYSQSKLARFIAAGCGSAGGSGNTAPIIARAGLRATVGAYLGKGDFDGLDVQGREFRDIMTRNGVDVSALKPHPALPTGTTFIKDRTANERGGIAYFPNANDDFDFDSFKPCVEQLKPKIVYYMYSGLSARGDARGGRDLADFMRWCRRQHGCLTVSDSHTLVADPEKAIEKAEPVEAYNLLRPLLPELDIFFTSADEAKMIANTLGHPRKWQDFEEIDNFRYVLEWLIDKFSGASSHASFFGITCARGAMGCYRNKAGLVKGPRMVESKFKADRVVDLVGAGDAFRAGLICYVARNAAAFKQGDFNFEDAIQVGNLTALSYITAPWDDRYANIDDYERMLRKIR